MKEPLAYLMRPKTLDDITGQEHLIGNGKYLTEMLKTKKYKSIVLYGKPGTGKTTIANVIADSTSLNVKKINAVSIFKKDLDEIFALAKLGDSDKPLLLVLDEIHRLNKDKQDLLLPYLESGEIIVIGMTTDNPFFAINPAIRSRCLLLEVKSSNEDDLLKLSKRAIKKSNEVYSENKNIDDDVLKLIIRVSSGDIRALINNIEHLLTLPYELINMEIYKENRLTLSGGDIGSEDMKYNLISALQKSIRGSDVNAALYYFGQLSLIGDYDAIARRIAVTAYEDIGLANLELCTQVSIAIDMGRRVGFPEANLILAPIIIKLCLSPKSKSAHDAIKRVEKYLNNGIKEMPEYLKLTNSLDMAHKYPYNKPEAWKYIQYMPEEIKDKIFYIPNTKNTNEKQDSVMYEKLNKNYHNVNNLANFS